MGFGNEPTAIYFTINGEGKITQKVSSDTEGAVSRVNKLGNEVWEVFHNYIEGHIYKVSKYDHPEYGLSYYIHFTDLDGEYKLQLDKYLFFYFVQVMPNINADHIVKVKTYKKKDDRVGLIFSQEGVRLYWHYTKDSGNNMPAIEPVKNKKGETIEWDDSDRLDFYDDLIADFNGDATEPEKRPTRDTEVEANIKLVKDTLGLEDVGKGEGEDLPF